MHVQTRAAPPVTTAYNSYITIIPFDAENRKWADYQPPVARVVGNLRRPPKTCHSSSESWENGDSEDVIRYAGKIRPFLKFQYLHNIRNYFFWLDLRRLPSQQMPNIWYVLVANMLESNPVVRNISEIHLRLHKLRCIPILTLHIQHGSHSPPPAASL